MCLGKKLNHYTLGDKTVKSRPNRTNFSQNNFEHFLHRFLCLLHDVQNKVLYRCKIGGNCFHKPKKQLGLRWSDVSIWLQLRLIAIELLAIRRIATARLSGGAQFVGNRNATKEWRGGGVATGDGEATGNQAHARPVASRSWPSGTRPSTAEIELVWASFGRIITHDNRLNGTDRWMNGRTERTGRTGSRASWLYCTTTAIRWIVHDDRETSQTHSPLGCFCALPSANDTANITASQRHMQRLMSSVSVYVCCIERWPKQALITSSSCRIKRPSNCRAVPNIHGLIIIKNTTQDSV